MNPPDPTPPPAAPRETDYWAKEAVKAITLKYDFLYQADRHDMADMIQRAAAPQLERLAKENERLMKDRNEWREKHWNAHHHSQEFFKDLTAANERLARMEEDKSALVELFEANPSALYSRLSTAIQTLEAVSSSGPLNNGLRDENTMALVNKTLSALAAHSNNGRASEGK